MGEIKSTLDLVFEKTKNLTLSDEEKLNLAREKIDKNVQGLCSRYLENFFPLSRLEDEMEKVAENDRDHAYRFLKKYLLSRFDLDSDNSLIVSALSEITDYNMTFLNILQKEYSLEKEETKKTLKEKSLQALKERGVSGSAVRVNFDAITEWNEFFKTLRERYQERLKATENN